MRHGGDRSEDERRQNERVKRFHCTGFVVVNGEQPEVWFSTSCQNVELRRHSLKSRRRECTGHVMMWTDGEHLGVNSLMAA